MRVFLWLKFVGARRQSTFSWNPKIFQHHRGRSGIWKPFGPKPKIKPKNDATSEQTQSSGSEVGVALATELLEKWHETMYSLKEKLL